MASKHEQMSGPLGQGAWGIGVAGKTVSLTLVPFRGWPATAQTATPEELRTLARNLDLAADLAEGKEG